GGSCIGGSASGPGDLVKNGPKTLVLAGTGTNTYSGNTIVNSGPLLIAKSSALGGTAHGTTVAAGALLALEGGIDVAGEALSLQGDGIRGNGALGSIRNNNTWD